MNPTIRFASLTALIAFATPAIGEPLQATLYKNPQCGCCEGYAAYLRDYG